MVSLEIVISGMHDRVSVDIDSGRSWLLGVVTVAALKGFRYAIERIVICYGLLATYLGPESSFDIQQFPRCRNAGLTHAGRYR